MEKIVIAGATGFIGRFLKAYYENKGSEVVALSRSKEAGFSYWNPDKKELDFAAFSLILIIPLKRDFDLFLRIDFSTTLPSVSLAS